MKRTTLLAIITVFTGIAAFPPDASAYYHAQLGRFINRDPIGYRAGDVNVYRYVQNRPTSGTDPSGLWWPGTHKELTKASLIKGMPVGDVSCVYAILSRLQAANVGQDKGGILGGPQDPGQEFFRHYCRRPGVSKAAADSLHLTYIRIELRDFNREVARPSPTAANCLSALKALGRVSHTWQDFYAHAVGTAAEKYEIWTNRRLVKGNAGAPGGDVMAAQYGGDNEEHGWREPASRDSAAGTALRKSDAISFVAAQYSTLLPAWLKACRCHFCP